MMHGYAAENSKGTGRGQAAPPVRGRMAALKWAFPLTLPVMAGYVFLGITYGILMVRQGLPVWLPIVTAAVVYTGSMEFLLTSILVSSFNPASAFATAIMVGARHLFYGISMLGKYRGMGWKKFYLIFTTSDETFAINYSAEIPDDIDRGWFYFWVSLLDQGYWHDGIYTPSSPDKFAEDILAMKALGFNTLRKHIKIEPEIFYYECDRLGMVVFQDMVNNSDYSFLHDTVLPTIGLTKLSDVKTHADRDRKTSVQPSVHLLLDHLQ